jgi:hypothetical protein
MIDGIDDNDEKSSFQYLSLRRYSLLTGTTTMPGRQIRGDSQHGGILRPRSAGESRFAWTRIAACNEECRVFADGTVLHPFYPGDFPVRLSIQVP